MTYTNWSLVAEKPLPNGSRGAVAKRDIAAGQLLGIFQGDLERIAIRDNRLTEPDKHINLVQIARDGDLSSGSSAASAPASGSSTIPASPMSGSRTRSWWWRTAISRKAKH